MLTDRAPLVRERLRPVWSKRRAKLRENARKNARKWEKIWTIDAPLEVGLRVQAGRLGRLYNNITVNSF